MNITLLDAETLGNDLNFDIFSAFGQTVVYRNTLPNEVESRIADSDIIIVNKIKLNAQNLQKASRLKLICVAATGFDNIDMAYCRLHGIGVCNVVGYSTHSVAQLTLAMVLSLSVHLTEYRSFVHSGQYTKSGVANRLTPTYHELCGKVWGIVGMGNIGKQVARVAESMGCRVIGFRRTKDSAFACCSLDDLCRQADIISVHLPLSEETKGIIDRKRISTMKQDVIFVNVSRGAVADEEALANAVIEHKIGGLGIDVYASEPFDQHHPYNALLDLPNVCLTPHMAWGAYESRARCLEEMAENIRAFLNGTRRNRLD